MCKLGCIYKNHTWKNTYKEFFFQNWLAYQLFETQEDGIDNVPHAEWVPGLHFFSVHFLIFSWF